jgi:hypothetical protein
MIGVAHAEEEFAGDLQARGEPFDRLFAQLQRQFVEVALEREELEVGDGVRGDFQDDRDGGRRALGLADRRLGDHHQDFDQVVLGVALARPGREARALGDEEDAAPGES